MGKKTLAGKVLTTDSEVATYFLESVGVAVVPGEAFVSRYFRISYAASLDVLEEASARLKKAVEQLS